MCAVYVVALTGPAILRLNHRVWSVLTIFYSELPELGGTNKISAMMMVTCLKDLDRALSIRLPCFQLSYIRELFSSNYGNDYT